MVDVLETLLAYSPDIMSNCTVFLAVVKETFGFNDSAGPPKSCDRLSDNGSDIIIQSHDLSLPSAMLYKVGIDIYGYVTPFIVLIGFIGNSISLKVFTSKFMTRLSSSLYLAVLSASHLLILLTYILLHWLDKGLPRWPGDHNFQLINFEGGCHLFLYVSYTLRLTSVWLIVAFTVERYIAICHSHKRRAVCSRGFAKRVTCAIFLFAGLVSCYKPILSGVYKLSDNGIAMCRRNPDLSNLNFILDSIYVVLITALPSCIISALSIPIFRKLRTKHKSSKAGQRLVFKENRIRLEFTGILLAISWCFIVLTIPYFATWCQQFRQSAMAMTIAQAHHNSGQLYIARAVFYLNYSVNFFLYCLTGAHYRREIRSLLKLRYNIEREKSSSSGGYRL